MHCAVRHRTTANAGKVADMRALFPAYRQALAATMRVIVQDTQQGRDVPSWPSLKPADVQSPLSGRHYKSVWNMAYAARASWLTKVRDEVRKVITGSSLDEDTKTALYRVNARQGWYAKEFELPWEATVDGVLTVPVKGAKVPAVHVMLPVAGEHMFLLRRIVKHVTAHQCPRPDLSKVRTITLDSPVAPVHVRGGAHTRWVRVSTLRTGRPTWLPLVNNPYLTKTMGRPGARLAGAVQLHQVGDRVEVSLIVTSEDAPVRELGRDLALDWGMSSALFATDDGRLLGRGILTRLAELDRILTPHTADLQRRGVKLKTDPYFQQLNRRIGDFMTNEVNRVLNRLAAEQVRSFTVEALDFRHGGLSKRMNRIVTRAGRAAVQAKLDRLHETHGITTVKVPAPYSSQQCSGCDYTHKTNRRSQARFRCRFCGKKLHADVNSSRSLAKRRSLGNAEGSGPRARKNILLVLDTQHRKRWGLPVPGAIPGVAGAPGEQAA